MAGRLGFVLGDGRVFRAEGRHPGPVAVIEVHNPDPFARLTIDDRAGFFWLVSRLNLTSIRVVPTGERPR